MFNLFFKLPSEAENVRVDVYVDASYARGLAGYGFIVFYGHMTVSLGRMCEKWSRFKYIKIMSNCKPVVDDLNILLEEE